MVDSHRSSFSQHKTFLECPLTWYWSSILKVPQDADMCYAHGGNCVHYSLDKYYSNNKDKELARETFETNWSKFGLSNSKIALKKDEYWMMVLNGMDLDKPLTTTELKIYYPDSIAYIDGVDSINDEIIDWKSSTKTQETDKEYELQLRMYAWLYYRKFGRIPKKSTVHYLKYSGSKSELSFSFTLEDIQEAEKWYYDILEKMVFYKNNPSKLPPFNHNYHWCPYKKFWGSENGDKIKFTIHLYGNHLQVEGPITELLNKGIVKKFSYELKNSHWIKKAKPMANTTINFWNSTKKTLPIGFKDGLLKTLGDYAEHKKAQLDLEIIDHREFDNTTIEMPDKFINDRILRDYQEEAVDKFLRKKFGVLEVATGSGKTEIAIEIIRRLGVKTLFVVDKIELLRQTKKRIEDSLGIKVGIIGAGEEYIQDVTVATIQTLTTNLGKYSSYLRTVRFGVLDETHKIASSSYVRLSRYLIGTEYRLGLSGTAYRDDGNDMQIFAVAGDIIHKLGSADLIEQGWLMRPYIIFIRNFITQGQIERMETECKEGLINETEKYSNYYDRFITNNSYRNNKIMEIAQNHKNKKILILTKLIDHGKHLNAIIPNSEHLYGETNKTEREDIFKRFIEGDFNVLISTISIFAEGIDIPSLDMVINASSNKGDVKTVQVLGRVLRKLDGKKQAMYIDFFDDVRFFKSSSLSRMRILKEEGHSIKIADTV